MKVAGLACNFIKKEAPTEMFSSESFFHTIPPVTTY